MGLAASPCGRPGGAGGASPVIEWHYLLICVSIHPPPLIINLPNKQISVGQNKSPAINLDRGSMFPSHKRQCLRAPSVPPV